MATWHLCKDRPDYDPESDDPKKADPWVEERIEGCPYHGPTRHKQLGYRPGRAERARMDREAGVVGVDRGTHVTGV